MTQTSHFDELETRAPSDREQDLFSKLPAHLDRSTKRCSGLKAHLAGIDLASIASRAQLATLPILRKSQLVDAQQSDPPFGGFADPESLHGTRVFMSPGPVWEPQPPGVDPWSSARALFAAGIRAGDGVHNAFSYHMTPGGFLIDEGARALGCLVFPAGVGNTDTQVEAARHFGPKAYVGTPDYLKIMLDNADAAGSPLTSLTLALVSGGALFPAMREEYQQRGVQVMQCYATADLGVICYESRAGDQLVEGMVCNEDLIVEIVRPGTNEPIPDGEVGELVVTTFNTAYPLIRFGTGDLSSHTARSKSLWTNRHANHGLDGTR